VHLSWAIARAVGSLLISSISVSAQAQELAPGPDTARDSCLASHELAQELKLQGKLLESKKTLLSCADEQCPSIVRSDCVRWLDEVESAVPTLVVVAISDAGDEINVSVTIDGKLVTNQLDGKPIELNPGVHDLAFELAGAKPKTLRVNVGQGEKNRIVRLDYRQKISAVQLAPPARVAETPAFAPINYVLGGVAAAGLISTTYFGIRAVMAHEDARSCEPMCSSAVANDVRRKSLYADLSLAVTVLAAGGILVVNTRCPAALPNTAPQRGGLTVRGLGFAMIRGGAMTAFGGTFE